MIKFRSKNGALSNRHSCTQAPSNKSVPTVRQIHSIRGKKHPFQKENKQSLKLTQKVGLTFFSYQNLLERLTILENIQKEIPSVIEKKVKPIYYI